MPKMDWHEAVLDELRRTRAAAEKIVGMLQTMDRPVKTEHGDRLVNEDNSFVKPQLSYADWRRAAAYTNIPMEIEQIRANEANNFFGISPFSE